MGLQESVRECLAKYSDLPEDLHGHVSHEIATIVGRQRNEGAIGYNVRAIAKKDGVYFGESQKIKTFATPSTRLYAACSQLEGIVDKLTSSKGAYLMGEVQACVTVSPALIELWQKEVAKQEVPAT